MSAAFDKEREDEIEELKNEIKEIEDAIQKVDDDIKNLEDDYLLSLERMSKEELILEIYAWYEETKKLEEFFETLPQKVGALKITESPLDHFSFSRKKEG